MSMPTLHSLFVNCKLRGIRETSADPRSHSQSDRPYELPAIVPEIPKKPIKEKALPPSPPPPQIVGQKRPAPEDEAASEAKRVKTSEVPSGTDMASAQMVYDSDDDIEIL